jgi:hypothetical protein
MVTNTKLEGVIQSTGTSYDSAYYAITAVAHTTTASEMTQQIGTNGAVTTITTPTAAQFILDTHATVGQSFDWIILQNSADLITISAGVGFTVTGAAATLGTVSRVHRLLIRVNSATTCIAYID